MNYFEGNEFFLLLFVVLLIGFVLNYFGKRKDYYILSLSILFAGAIYGKSKSMVRVNPWLFIYWLSLSTNMS